MSRSRISIRPTYNPANAPRLYQPALVNGTRVAVDPATGQTLNAIYIGAYVPGTGNQANGMVLQTDSGVPRGFRKVLAPQMEPRVGFSWDMTGGGRMVLHSSAGHFHNARLGGGSAGNLRNPPYILNPIIFYNTMATTFVPGVTPANRPGNVEALETTYKTPSSFNWSIGLRRELGWGTSLDATYAGSVGRNMEMYYDLNAVQDGVRYVDLNPPAHDPGNTSPTAVLPPEFLRPYSGYQSIRVRGNSATSDYHSLQVQVNRRYIHGVQFGGAYTLQRAQRPRRRGSRQPVDRLQPAARLLLFGAGAERPALARAQLRMGYFAEPFFERGAPPRARRVAAVRRERVHQRRLGTGHPHDQRQLRLHRR